MTRKKKSVSSRGKAASKPGSASPSYEEVKRASELRWLEETWKKIDAAVSLRVKRGEL